MCESENPAEQADIEHRPARKVALCGITLDALTLSETVQAVEAALAAGRQTSISVVNVAKLVNLRRDALLRESVVAGNLVLADGMPLVWLSHVLGRPLPERVAGVDLMFGLLRSADRHRLRVFFLGATLEILSQVVRVARRDYPSMVLAGFHHGYFDAAQEPAVARRIRDARPDILLVAMSSPKKELFMQRWVEEVGAKVVHGVGGSFDIMAGRTRRAPAWMQRAGCEWLYRLLQEPRRMWKRYLFTNVQFLILAGREILSARGPQQS